MDILFSNFWKTWLNLHFCRRSPVRLSIYLSVWPFASDIFLSGSTLDFVIILHQEILPHTLERNKAWFRLCVDSWGVANWVSKINLDQNRTFAIWFPIIGYMILWKGHIWEAYGSQVIDQNAQEWNFSKAIQGKMIINCM